MKKEKLAIHVIPILLICIVSFRNLLPEGYIVAGGDFVQWFNFPRQFSNYAYSWANESLGYGQIAQSNILYYLLTAPLIVLFRLSVSEQSFLYYMIFLLPAYFSFYLAASCYEEQIGEVGIIWKAILSTGYAFNIFTFYNFIGLWGYSPFFFLYVLIPIIFAITYRYFIRSGINVLDLALLGIIFFFVNIPTGNFPFFVSLNIVLFLYGIATAKITFRTDVAKKFIYFFFIIAAATLWSVLPQLPELINGQKFIIKENAALGLAEWVIGQAAKFPDPFLLVNDHRFFLGFPFLMLSSIALLMATMLVPLLGDHRIGTKRASITMLFMYLFTIFLLNKGRGIMPDWLISTIFANSIMGALRSFHKTIIYLPYFLHTIIFFGLSSSGRYTKLIKILVVIAVTLPVIYFVRGEILVSYSYNYVKGKNYLTSDEAPIVKIPADYITISWQLNQDSSTHRILSAPYSLEETTFGWRKIPRWKYLGSSDPVWQLFNAPFVQMNDSSIFGGWNFGEQWNAESPSEATWIIPLAGLMNVKYILFHTDVREIFWLDAQEKMDEFVKKGLLESVKKNNFFKIYEINSKFVYPRVYMPRHIKVLDDNRNIQATGALDISAPVEAFFFQKNMSEYFKREVYNITAASGGTIEYKRINPTKYRVWVRNAKGSFAVILLESFRAEWNVYLADPQHTLDKELHVDITTKQRSTDGEKTGSLARETNSLSDGKFYETWFGDKISSDRNHHSANGFANSWILDAESVCANQKKCIRNADGSYDLELILEYWPQQLLYVGMFLSSLTFVLCMVYVAYRMRRAHVAGNHK